MHLSFFEKGAYKTPRDGLGWFHKDEMVLPADVAGDLRRALDIGPTAGDGAR